MFARLTANPSLRGALLAALLWTWPAWTTAQEWSQAELSKARTAAESTRLSLQKLRSFDHTGFASAAELQASVVGEAMSDAPLRADELIGSDPPTDFTPGTQLVFPLVLAGTIRAFIVLEKDPVAGWQPIRFFESQESTRLAFEIREAQRDGLPEAKLEFYLVRSPALNLQVLGMRVDGVPVIVPLSAEDPHFGGSMGFIRFADGVSIMRRYYINQLLQRADLGWLQQRGLRRRLERTPAPKALVAPAGPKGTPLDASLRMGK